MNNFKFTVLGFLAMALAVVPIPFALAWGYAATPMAVVSVGLAMVVLHRIMKEANRGGKK